MISLRKNRSICAKIHGFLLQKTDDCPIVNADSWTDRSVWRGMILTWLCSSKQKTSATIHIQYLMILMSQALGNPPFGHQSRVSNVGLASLTNWRPRRQNWPNKFWTANERPKILAGKWIFTS
jgi:hypothetical protein